MKSLKGAGDLVAAVTKATGIDKIAKWLNPDCGCDERQAWLNAKFRWKKPRCMNEKELLFWKMNRDDLYVGKRAGGHRGREAMDIHHDLFGDPVKYPCTCSGRVWYERYQELEELYNMCRE